MTKPTHLFTFSGVHGAGKTSVINDLANRLTSIGKRVFVLQEFPYVPNIQIGTMEFQAWYQTAMQQRSAVVKKLEWMFDVILLDRHPMDVDVYSARLRDSRVDEVVLEEDVKTMHQAYELDWYWGGSDNDIKMYRHKEYTAMFLFERPVDELVLSLQLRREKETHRKEWGEEKTSYLKEIIEKFRLFKKNPKTIFIENEVLSDTKDLVFDYVIRRIRDD